MSLIKGHKTEHTQMILMMRGMKGQNYNILEVENGFNTHLVDVSPDLASEIPKCES